jgi:hypothetical protein
MAEPKTVEELYAASEGVGKIQTTDDVVARSVIKNLVYEVSDLISVGEQVINTKELDDLKAEWHVPNSFEVDYPVAEGARGPRKEIEWYKKELDLWKASVRFLITDEAKIRGQENWQWETSLRRAGEGMAGVIDACILDNLYLYHYTSNDKAASNEWDTAAGTPEDDLIVVWGNILANSNVTEGELRSAQVVVPVAVYPYLMQIQLINNVQQSTSNFLTSSFGMSFLPTRRTSSNDYGYALSGGFDGTDALMVIKSPDSAVFGTYNGDAANLVEQAREVGVGDEYNVRRFFNVAVIPRTSSDTTNERLGAVTTVNS